MTNISIQLSESDATTEETPDEYQSSEHYFSRFWIATTGESVYTDCGGGYLRSAVQTDPDAFRHITPLHDWLEFTKAVVDDLRLEHCGVTSE